MRQYTNAEFTILEIEDDKSGETRVIIKFNDSEKASSFVETVKASNGNNAGIKNVEFISGYYAYSLSFKVHPMSLLGLFIF